MKIIFATQNNGKVIEMRNILKDINVEVLSAKEVGITDNIIEDGETFEENALKKARFVAEKSGLWAIADDSGLCIEALDGAPGIYSARWPGENATPKDFEQKTISSISNKPNRRAWFETALVLVAPDKRHWTFTGKVYGAIPAAPRGTSLPGLPYDSVFIPDGYDKTFAEISGTEKNEISHRGLAFGRFKEFLKSEPGT